MNLVQNLQSSFFLYPNDARYPGNYVSSDGEEEETEYSSYHTKKTLSKTEYISIESEGHSKS